MAGSLLIESVWNILEILMDGFLMPSGEVGQMLKIDFIPVRILVD